MAFVAEPFSTGVAFPAFREIYIAANSVANNFLPDTPQQLPVMISHIDGIPDAFIILGSGPLQKRRGILGSARKDVRCGAVYQRNQDDQDRNYYGNISFEFAVFVIWSHIHLRCYDTWAESVDTSGESAATAVSPPVFILLAVSVFFTIRPVCSLYTRATVRYIRWANFE